MFWFIVIGLLLVTTICPAQVVQDEAKSPANSPASELPDTVFLRSGGELSGKVLSEKKDEDSGRTFVVLRMESGGVVKLDSARLVRKVHYADAIDAEYQRRLKIAGNDANLYWKIYEWCQEQPSGSARFKDELKFLLERIAAIDPNDERSRQLLGFDLVDGQWIMKPALYKAHGYRKNGTSWASELQFSIFDQQEAQNRIEADRKKKINLWLKIANRPDANRSEVTQSLFAICDEEAIPILFKEHAKEESDPQLRMIYLEAFGRVPSRASMVALCYFAIQDPEIANRERALTLLQQPQFDQQSAASLMSGHLLHMEPVFLRRAAFAIGELKGISAAIALIDALEIKETITVGGAQPGQMNLSFGSGGAGLAVGGEPQKVESMVKVDESRVSLKKISGQDFGFDKQAWKNWYLQNYTLHDARVRGDD